MFKIVPVEVPSSRREVERGRMCLRKTLGGVDLNRNWPVGWVMLRARWVTLRARWVMLRARWVTLRAR